MALARQLVERAVGAGETAYPGSGFDIAEAHHLLARSLQMSGDCRAALPIVEEAWQRFQREAASSNEESSYIEDSCLTTLADCLASMGCFDEAAGIYEATIEHARGRGDLRNVAVGKFQLGSVLMQQKRHENALVAFRAALEILTTLQERPMIGSAWHQIGMAHRKLDQFEAAEKAYQNALRLLVSVPNRRNEALTLIELGNLYAAWGRQEDAVSFSHKAAEILVRPGIEDLASEGSARLNAASSLCELQRYDEARREISRAIECNEPFGHTTRPWIAYDVLSRLELATGDALAAASARARAMAAYLAYRRDGGDGIARFAPSCASAEMVLNGQPDEVPAQLRDLDALGSSPELNAESKAFVAALSAILRGAREPAIAQSTDLHYLDSAELLLLLERLESAKLTQQQIEEPTEASSS